MMAGHVCLTDGKLGLTDCDYMLSFVPSVRFGHMIEGPL